MRVILSQPLKSPGLVHPQFSTSRRLKTYSPMQRMGGPSPRRTIPRNRPALKPPLPSQAPITVSSRGPAKNLRRQPTTQPLLLPITTSHPLSRARSRYPTTVRGHPPRGRPVHLPKPPMPPPPTSPLSHPARNLKRSSRHQPAVTPPKIIRHSGPRAGRRCAEPESIPQTSPHQHPTQPLSPTL